MEPAPQRQVLCRSCQQWIWIPSAGQWMSCDFCGSQQLVPPVTGELRLGASPVAGSPGPTDSTGLRGVRAVIASLVAIAAVVAVAFTAGLFDRFLEPDWGDTGIARYQLAAKRAKESGFQPVHRPREERVGQEGITLTVTMTAEHCYAIVIGAGRRIASLTLYDQHGKARVHRAGRAHESVVHCPMEAGERRVTIRLERPGRLSWALFRRPRRRASP